MRDRKSAIMSFAASHQFEDELASERPVPASALAARRTLPAAMHDV
jgi:hypothetical protein